jgi:lysophospholipase L1-like esterase
MKKRISYRSLVALAAIAAGSFIIGGSSGFALAQETTEKAAPAAPFEKEIQAFEEKDKKSFPPADAVLFIGSSSIRRWTTLAKDFPEIPVINRGFGGSQIEDSVRYVPRIVLPYKPRLIVMYAGGNDLEGKKTPADVRDDFKAFVTQSRTGLPDVPIVYISINPSLKRLKNVEKTREANRLIEEYTRTEPRLTFINSYTPLLGPDGQPQKELLVEDGLHLSKEGYKQWTAVVKPIILKLYQEAKPQPATP